MNNSVFIIFALSLLFFPSAYADGPYHAPDMGNMSIGIPESPNPLPHQDTQKAIMQSNSHSDATIMQNQARQPMGRRLEGSGMQNGMNSSMGVR